MRYKGDREYSKINSLINYKANLEARRGNNFVYETDELIHELTKKGYKKYSFENENIGDGRYTHYLQKAKDVVAKLRADGNYARIICGTNRLRHTEYSIYYKKRVNKSKAKVK